MYLWVKLILIPSGLSGIAHIFPVDTFDVLQVSRIFKFCDKRIYTPPPPPPPKKKKKKKTSQEIQVAHNFSLFNLNAWYSIGVK